jgi:hypothetical protein
MSLCDRFWVPSFWWWLSKEATWIILADMVPQWELPRTQHRVVMVEVTAGDPLTQEEVTLRADMEVTMSR